MSKTCKWLTVIAISYLDLASNATEDLSTYCRNNLLLSAIEVGVSNNIKNVTTLCNKVLNTPSVNLILKYLRSASNELKIIYHRAHSNFTVFSRQYLNTSSRILGDNIVRHIKCALDTIENAMSSLKTS